MPSAGREVGRELAWPLFVLAASPPEADSPLHEPARSGFLPSALPPEADSSGRGPDRVRSEAGHVSPQLALPRQPGSKPLASPLATAIRLASTRPSSQSDPERLQLWLPLGSKTRLGPRHQSLPQPQG